MLYTLLFLTSFNVLNPFYAIFNGMQSNILETYYLGIWIDMVKLCWIISNSVHFQMQIEKNITVGRAVNRQSCGLF